MLRTTTLIATSLCLTALAGCTSDSPDPVNDGAVDRAGEEAPAAAADWQTWVASENERIQDADAGFYDQVLRIEPTRTRNGFLRLTDPIIHNPDAAPILIHRLTSAQEDSMVRAAIAEALPRTGGSFSAALPDLIRAESDDVVRSVLVGTLRRAEPAHALAGLRIALEDPSADVRAEAARTASRRSDGAALATELIVALGDDEVGARTEAARALSALRVKEAVPALIQGLDDTEADVRLACLRGLARVDADAVERLDRLDTLTADPDPRVAGAARKLAAQR